MGMCPSCNNHNYASKSVCNKCGYPKPEVTTYGACRGGGKGAAHASPYGAFGASAPPPPTSAPPAHVMAQFAGGSGKGLPKGSTWREGDWVCGSCNNYNYASK